ncbi:HECT-type E3 ubiquitin transferase [Malassezia cuniculi]|uniref:HECT-type E3 ubiquitin transferase n=1 Tax=Malassezia cuniculi TaxID=948313 RepID=A0AAF0ENT0_9BASI|nr:HECT-type E3 ubiquitin transferase [Malassezia cuniculi]
MEFNFTGSSRPQRTINLGGAPGSSAAQLAAEARARRLQRSQERERIAAARRIQVAFRQFATARAAQLRHAEEFESQRTLLSAGDAPWINATRALLLSCRISGAADDAQTLRLDAWAAAALATPDIRTAGGDSAVWHSLLASALRRLLQQLADHAERIPIDVAGRWLTLFERLVDGMLELLVRARLYDAIFAHTLRLPVSREPSAGSAASLALYGVQHLAVPDASVVPNSSKDAPGPVALHGFVRWLAVPELSARLPIAALSALAAAFPLDMVAVHITALGSYYDASTGDSALPNNPIHGSLLENIVRLSRARVAHLTSAQLGHYLSMLATLINASGGHVEFVTDASNLVPLLNASRKHPSTRPVLCEFLLALLCADTDRESVLTTALFTSDSAASGVSGLIVRELWRGWVRNSAPARQIGTGRGSSGAESALKAIQLDSTTEWSAFVILCELYSRCLVTLGDDEFYPENMRNPLTIDEVVSFSALLRNLGFALYWHSVEGRLPGTRLEFSAMRLLTTRLLQQLYIRDSRRAFAPQGHWHMLDARELPLLLQAAAADADEMDIDNAPRSRASSASLNVLDNIPFVVPFDVRVEIFRQYVSKDIARRGANTPYAPLFAHSATVRRNSVASDGMVQLGPLGARLKEPVKITFIDEFGQEEAGIDGGGVFKEFLTALVREAFDTDRGLWCANAAQELYPNPHSYARGEEQLAWYTFLGRIIGKALYEGILVNAQFARFFLSKWLGQKSYLDDLASLDSLDPVLYRGLLYLKNYTGDVESDLALNFTVADDEFGVNQTTELVPDIIEPRWLRMFDPEELRVLVSGADRDIDLADLRANTVYGGYHEKDPSVQYFWEALETMDSASRRAFLRFVTSSPNPPLLGFGELNPKFAIRHAGNDTTRLPTASTCVNLLKLPEYSSREQCLEKLRYAIDSAADAIEGGARIENLSWRLMSRKLPAQRDTKRPSKHTIRLHTPLSEPELSTDESGTSESGSETGTNSEHSACDSHDDALAAFDGDSHHDALTAILAARAWRNEQHAEVISESACNSPTQESSTPRGTVTPLAHWSRSRANSRSSVREYQRLSHSVRTHSRTVSRSSVDTERLKSGAAESGHSAIAPDTTEIPPEFVAAQPPTPQAQPPAPAPMRVSQDAADDKRAAKSQEKPDAPAQLSAPTVQENSGAAPEHMDAAQQTTPDVQEPAAATGPAEMSSVSQESQPKVETSKTKPKKKLSLETPVRMPTVSIAEETSPTTVVPPALAALPARRFALPAPQAEEPKLPITKRGSVTTLARGRTRQHKSTERLTGLRGAGRAGNRSTQGLAQLGMTSRTTEPAQRRKKDKIMFMTGDDDASDDEEEKAEEDDWSDDEAAEEEERRLAAEKAAKQAAEEKRQREIAEEQERLEMFKKRPIRSVSLADLSAASARVSRNVQQAPAEEAEGHAVPPRGLLSSIFGSTTTLHSLQEEVSASKSGGASKSTSSSRAARDESRSSRSGRTINFAALPAGPHGVGRNPSTPAMIRQTAIPKSSLDRSKSAIALPMLDRTSLRMSTAAAANRDSSAERRSGSSWNSKSSQGTEQDDRESQPKRSKSNTALLRLAALANGRKSVTDLTNAVSTVELSEQAAEDDGLSLSVKRCPSDDFEGERIERQLTDQSPQSRRVVIRDAQRQNAHVALNSPRTTRQNMLLDELSESLRQNLLWERQSRARMFGMAPANESIRPNNRTSRAAGDRDRDREHDRLELEADEESFHHKGW